MSDQMKSGYCQVCEKRVPVSRPRANHILHFFLSLFTFGLWVLVWLGLSIKFGGWRCVKCGSKAIKEVL